MASGTRPYLLSVPGGLTHFDKNKEGVRKARIADIEIVFETCNLTDGVIYISGSVED